jgi:hypothetical protein
MNCHGKNKEKQGNNNHSPLKHMFHMILCCGLPIVIIGFLPLISRISPGASKILGIVAPFICPIIMFGMFGMMFRNSKKQSCCNSDKDDVEIREPNKFIE